MRYQYLTRLLPALLLPVVLLALPGTAQAQFGKLKEKLRKVEEIGNKAERVGKGNSEINAIVSAMDSARIKSAYARVSLSLADDIIRRQALLNSTRKSTGGQIAKDQQEIKELDRSIAEKKKLLADLGRKSNSGKYDEQTDTSIQASLNEDEKRREEKRAMVDQELADRERRSGEMSKQERENYSLLAKILYGASKQEKDAMVTAKDTGPRAQSAAEHAQNNKEKWLETNPKQFQEGIDAMKVILAEGPQHLAVLTRVASHFGRIGGLDLTKGEFQAKIVTDEDEIPTDW
ncbi:MAG: hypothetical protein U0Z53_09165 [Blastocatellia bacterium]